MNKRRIRSKHAQNYQNKGIKKLKYTQFNFTSLEIVPQTTIPSAREAFDCHCCSCYSVNKIKSIYHCIQNCICVHVPFSQTLLIIFMAWSSIAVTGTKISSPFQHCHCFYWRQTTHTHRPEYGFIAFFSLLLKRLLPHIFKPIYKLLCKITFQHFIFNGQKSQCVSNQHFPFLLYIKLYTTFAFSYIVF